MIITTLSRPWAQRTLEALPDDISDQVELWVQAQEFDLYSSIYEGVHALPPNIQRLGPTRQYLVDYYRGEKIVLMDDDLGFLWREDPDRWQLTVPPYHAIRQMFEEIEEALDRYVHVGVSGREGNNREMSYSVESTRYMRLLAYNTATMPHDVVVDRLDGMSDFDTNLQLLRRGLPSLVFYRWSQGQRSTQAPGGCAVYRTQDTHSAEVAAMLELHPGLVTPVQKRNRSGGEFGVRDEVVVAWKLALGWDERAGRVETPGERLAGQLAQSRLRVAELESGWIPFHDEVRTAGQLVALLDEARARIAELEAEVFSLQHTMVGE